MNSPEIVRFGVFELDRLTGELRKGGVRVKLQDQPFRVLAELTSRPSELVTREELRDKLWPGESYGDFDQNLNAVVKKVRQALGDSAETPRFIETLPKKGYRFIYPVEGADGSAAKPSRGLYFAAAAILAAAIGVAAWLGVVSPRQEQAAEPMRAVPLTSYPGFESQPSFSPDGEQVVFSWDGGKQDNNDIYVVRVGAPKPLRLTTNPDRDYNPVWSPDGRSIAFLRDQGHGKSDVLLIPAIGGPERKLTETSVGWGGLAWLPDGRGIVVSDIANPEEPASLFLFSIDTGEKQRLTSPLPGPWDDSDPTFSPDGHSLVFARRTRYGWRDLYLLPLSEEFIPEGEPRRLTSKPQPVGGPSWTPDGSDLIFHVGSFYYSGLGRMSVSDPKEPEPLAGVGQGARGPAVSPAMRRLVYSQASVDLDLSGLERGGTDDEWRPASFISSTRPELSPQYSPDGRRVAFSSQRTGTMGLWLSDPDGSNATPLYIIEGAHTGTPRWSPDGQRIAFDSDAGGEQNVYLISTSGGEPLKLTEHPADDLIPSWSAGGSSVYFTSNRTGRFEVWKVSGAGGQPVQITREGGTVAFDSPDGRWVYYLRSLGTNPDLWKVPAEGGEESLVVERVTRRNFVVFERGIYFMQSPAEDDREAGFTIRFLDFKTGAVSTVTTLDPSIRPSIGFTVSPDEESIIYTTVKHTGADLMLVENFR